MIEAKLAAAVRATVAQWAQARSAAQQLADIASPATLGAVLGLGTGAQLTGAGHDPAAVRREVLSVPFCHLGQVFDAGSLGDTPQGFSPVPDTAGTRAGRAAAMAVHGFLQMETVSYGTENDGNLFVNLVAMPGEGAFAEKSKKDMRGHTDGVSFPFDGEDDPGDARVAPSPQLVTLVGLRNPDSIATKVMSLEDALAGLSSGDIAELKKPQFSIRSQKTFVQAMKRILGRELVVVDQAVLRVVAGVTQVRYSHSCVVTLEEEGAANAAAKAFEARCNQVAMPVVVQSGDVLVINNRLGLHGRGRVGDAVGGHSRWLLRAYGLDTSKLAHQKRHLGSTPRHVLFP